MKFFTAIGVLLIVLGAIYLPDWYASYNRVFVVTLPEGVTRENFASFIAATEQSNATYGNGLGYLIRSGFGAVFALVLIAFAAGLAALLAYWFRGDDRARFNTQLKDFREKNAALEEQLKDLDAQLQAAQKHAESAEQRAADAESSSQALHKSFRIKNDELTKRLDDVKQQQSRLYAIIQAQQKFKEEFDGLKKAFLAEKGKNKELRKELNKYAGGDSPEAKDLARLRELESKYNDSLNSWQLFDRDYVQNCERALRFFARSAFPNSVKRNTTVQEIMEDFKQQKFSKGQSNETNSQQ